MLTGKEICPLEETVNICVFICLCPFQVRISYLYYAIIEKYMQEKLNLPLDNVAKTCAIFVMTPSMLDFETLDNSSETWNMVER